MFDADFEFILTMRKMKKNEKIMIAVLLTIMFSTTLFAQGKKYPSKEEDEYYKNFESNFEPFKQLEEGFILDFQSEYYEIRECVSNYMPFLHDKYSTPYADSILSIIVSHDFEMQNKLDFETIGGINKVQIIKYEKRDSIEAIIYEDSEFEDIWFGETGIWIGYSENNGKDWNYYYTGIVQCQPIFLKYYSQRPLINEKGKIEIEACLLLQLSPFSHPVSSHSYKCVKDGIFIVFDIDVISKDSDSDGLTDIVEDKLYTDKYNKDTDRDGIPDNLDANPRVSYPRTKKTKIFEAILSYDLGSKKRDWSSGRLIFKRNNAVYYVTDSTETVLIVTDDIDLMGIKPQGHRVIFMTTDEYKNKASAYQSELNKMAFTPFFRIDNKRNAYKISYSYNTWGYTYYVKKTIIGWRVKIISTIIS